MNNAAKALLLDAIEATQIRRPDLIISDLRAAVNFYHEFVLTYDGDGETESYAKAVVILEKARMVLSGALELQAALNDFTDDESRRKRALSRVNRTAEEGTE